MESCTAGLRPFVLIRCPTFSGNRILRARRNLHIVGVLMFVTFMLIVAIVYLNLLVAMMTSGYAKVRLTHHIVTIVMGFHEKDSDSAVDRVIISLLAELAYIIRAIFRKYTLSVAFCLTLLEPTCDK